ncbi:hypothetical protein RQM65_00500 [Pricia sp. S334]|uniref:Uncharacterized protein n=1 Tax=Pricia mediterranea TaxID=3076079 RepID=A0ABU3L204_9FLAO|nr:hypothetical protein [Pricia sp. S334]MDT7827142.1 hypothetical protein [Pricia sp. S334]
MSNLNPSRLRYGNFSNNYHMASGNTKASTGAEYLYSIDSLSNLDLDEQLPNVDIISAGNDGSGDRF